ncbi:acetyl-CoA acetyltransferase [Glutamicibacter uratoxydans]|uniref:Acetyl-CoA acetyltransferase n=1 Tax=Glutamicibacter uratoxydans TaxID=43667 RepID=A0A4Y4DSB2_GLUUR|nr:thiolase family protein [Glutamicibacter uratoxydans]GED06420.1 acetyl-CoA acetyltransferase [Glutamicibacter uratoxydans]
MNDAYLVLALRTPVVRAGKEFSRVGAEKLLGLVIDELLERSQIDPARIDHVFAGNAAGPGGNIARVAALSSRLPNSIGATSIDAQCASGLEAIASAARMIRSGEAHAVIAGGVESVSTAPWRMEKQTDPMIQPRLYSRARFTPAPDPDPDMGVAAENIAQRCGIDRARQDAFALRSHQRALQALAQGAFDAEIVAVPTSAGLVVNDTCPRSNLTMKKLQALKPAFVEGGSVSAGNSCPINDGASAVLLVSGQLLEELEIGFALKYVASASGGCDPEVLGLAAVPAFERLARTMGASPLQEDSFIEFNEAFAVQALACLDQLGIDERRVNQQGGALALGHPYGASGAILTTRLFWQARAASRTGQRSIALMAAAGGTGSAVAFESVVAPRTTG